MAGIVLRPNAQTLEVKGNAPSIGLGTLTISLGAIELQVLPPAVDVRQVLFAGVAVLELQAPDPVVDRNLPLSPDAAVLEVQARDGKVSIQQPARTMLLGVLVLELQAMDLARTIDGECLLAPDAALLEVRPEPPAAALTDRTLTPDAAELQLLPPTPAIALAPLVLTPDAAVLALVPPELARAEERVLTPGAAVLGVQPYDVGLTLHLFLAPQPAQLNVHAIPQAASITGDRTVRLGAALLVLQARDPSLLMIDVGDVPPRLQVRGRVAVSGILVRPDPELEDLGP
jgi:hypothetical protein